MIYPPNQMYQQPQNFVPQAQNYIMQAQPQPQMSSNRIWAQGEAGAKSWAVAPGKSVMLMDSESNTFYIKSSDTSGMPMPLRIFDYTERTQSNNKNITVQEKIDTSRFVTWEDFNKKLDELFTERKESKVDG